MDYSEFLRGSGISEEEFTLEDFKGAVWYARRKARLACRDMEYADRYLLPDVIAGIVFSRETERANERIRTDCNGAARMPQVG